MTKAKAIAVARALRRFGFTATAEGRPNCAYWVKVSCTDCVTVYEDGRSSHRFDCPKARS